MSEAEGFYELKRMFSVAGGAIAFLVAIYLLRAARTFLFGRRVSAVVVRIIPKGRSAAATVQYNYVLEYRDARSGETRMAQDSHGLGLKEFRVGDRVTAFVIGRRGTAEILSWRRMVFTLAAVALVALTLFIAYQLWIREPRVEAE